MSRRHVWASTSVRCIATVVLALFCTPGRAGTPLYEEEPYDQITLDAANNNAVIQVEPLDLQNRQLPATPKPNGKLVVRLSDAPERQYEIRWRSIARVDLFEDLILAGARDLVAAGNFDEAYGYLAFLERNWPTMPGLGEAMEEYLYEEAKQDFRKQQYDGALALLRELYRRNPKRQGLAEVLGRITESLVTGYVEKQDYTSARAMLSSLTAAFPEHPLVTQWNDRLRNRAAPLLIEARAATDSGQLAKAAELSRQVTTIWPGLPGARELAQTLQQQYPRVVVGTLTDSVVSGRVDDWAARRASRLVYRTLVEFAGPSVEGGEFICPVGEISSENLGRRLVVQLKPGMRWSEGNATLGSSDMSRQLLAMTDPHNAAYQVDWLDIVAAVSLRGVYGVEVDLRRAHVYPEAMLQIVLTPYAEPTSSGKPLPTNGPFVEQTRTPQEVVFTANPQYFAAQTGQLKELVERHFDTSAQALLALKRGEIQALDRINPWKLASLRADSQLVVAPYALPLVHCLVPNLRRPLLNDRTFRRALGYAIHRRAILQQLLSNNEIRGCKVTSSPFLLGVDADDPMSYASDDRIEPQRYDPQLAIALANVALKNRVATDKNQDNEGKSMPKLILAYPPDEIARTACLSIQKQLGLVSIPVELRPLQGPLSGRIPPDVDLLYVELAMWMPVVDARRVLGEDGIAGGCSPYMSLALRQLDYAVEWIQVRECLHRVHRVVRDDVAIIPLWQLVDHFAYRQSLQGIAAEPVSLYQNIEQWRLAFEYATEL